MGQSNKTGQRNPNNPPNPRNGQSMVPYNPELKYTQADFERFMIQARRAARAEFMAEIGVTELNSPSTPSSRWFEKGEEPTFPEMIKQERGALCLGNHTDDELAAELFIYGNMNEYEKTSALLSGKCSSIAYLMAGKERIRWLSRHLELSLACEELLSKRLAAYDEKVWKFLVDDDEYQGYNPDALRRLALEILPEDFVNNAMQPILTKLYNEGCIDEEGTRSGCLGSTMPYSGPIFAGTIPTKHHDVVVETIDGDGEAEALKSLIEANAKALYDSWSNTSGWVEWVEGGNSLMQSKARGQVRADMAKENPNAAF